MSYSIDVNLLIYAADVSHKRHHDAKQFLISCLSKNEACYLTWEVIFGFIRITTHPGILANPLTCQQAVDNMSNILENPHVSVLTVNELVWNFFQRISAEFPIRGKLVPDALLASTLQAHGIQTLYTHDRDMWKFPFLRPVDPFG